ncbi:MFS transporter [Cohnella fermenti]|uniref:MFS transporter n=1 Tax=Cohnella fermenti TaxID=2565925 RepID=A0A4S4BHH3_9BACL|nr:MFS transporter [Cohnella fermenti]THF73735.1 MFS transporter [Cohnella fermenti]
MPPYKSYQPPTTVRRSGFAPGPIAGTRWSVLLAYAFLAGATQLLWVAYTPITTDSAKEWGVSVDAVGWLAQVYPLLYVLLAIPFGYLADKRFKHTLAWGAVLTGAGALVRLVPGYEYALVGQMLVSIAQPFILNAVNKLAAMYAEPAKRPTAIAAGTASLFIGILVSSVTSPFLMDWGGLRAVHLTQAVLAVCSAILFLFALRRRPLYEVPQEEARFLASIRTVWSYRFVRVYSLLLFAGFGLFITLTTWLEVLSQPIGISSAEVGLAIGAMTLAGIVGAAVVPGWADIGSRSRYVLTASLAVSAAALTFLAIGKPVWLIFALFTLTGFLLLANLPVILTSAERESPPEEDGTVAGVLLMFGNLGGIVLTLAVQALLDHRPLAIGVLIAIVLLALPFVPLVPKRPSRR